MKEKILAIRKWSSKFQSEAAIPEIWHEPPVYFRILRILQGVEGQLIAITGKQGTGKSTLIHWLDHKLRELKIPTLKTIPKIFGSEFLKDVDTISKEILTQDEFTDFEAHQKEIEDEIINGHKWWNQDVLLIDFPDYSRHSKIQRNKDLTALMILWRNINGKVLPYRVNNILSKAGIKPKCPNILFVWQEELRSTKEHFSWGKILSIKLPALKAKDLTAYFIKRFESPAPFTNESLLYLGRMARGCWRWFMKYITICLNYFSYVDDEKITIDDINEWITEDDILEDWTRELVNVWPRKIDNHKIAVKIIRFLGEKGEITQTEIAELFFEGNKVSTSRLLGPLEAHDYISRRDKGQTKVVSLKDIMR